MWRCTWIHHFTLKISREVCRLVALHLSFLPPLVALSQVFLSLCHQASPCRAVHCPPYLSCALFPQFPPLASAVPIPHQPCCLPFHLHPVPHSSTSYCDVQWPYRQACKLSYVSLCAHFIAISSGPQKKQHDIAHVKPWKLKTCLISFLLFLPLNFMFIPSSLGGLKAFTRRRVS